MTISPGPIPAPLDESAQKHWVRFTEALDAWDDKSRAGELRDLCLSRPELKAVWAASDFIATTCIRKPGLLHGLLASGDLDNAWAPGALSRRVHAALNDCESEKELHVGLRQLRQREMVRIAWRDLCGMANLKETMDCVSQLAESCIGQALAHHHQWLSRRYGEPRNELGGKAKMVVLGLGKLGGNELNYSSDVDLIFAYDSQGATAFDVPDSHRANIDNQEYFIKLGRKIVTALDSVTADGFVFRTDMRLRPNGDSGPLVLSFSAMEHYYQTHGRDWERYALIKARLVAGDIEAGAELLAILKPFVYRKYLDFSAFDAIREMKGAIERELRNKGVDENIKLGWGGIREIEFLVQSHQLIRGGREKNLQTHSLYQAVDYLVDLGVIDNGARQQLMEGYRFLRNTEHRLQMVADRQTQQLPVNDYERQRLAWSMGFDSWPAYKEKLDACRMDVHHQFKMILDRDVPRETHTDAADLQLVDLWQGKMEQEDAINTLRAAGFPQVEYTPQLLRGFREGRLYQAFSNIERDRIDRLIPLALLQAAKHKDAERAMAAFISVVEAIGRRSVYLSLLLENSIALKQLLHLCAASPWISTHIGRHPVILDELLNPLVDIRNRSDQALEEELDHRLDQVDANDEEGRMNAFREFHHAQVLRIAAADVSGVLRVSDIHQALTQLACVLLRRIFGEAMEFTGRKNTIPSWDAGVIAYGKLGSGELGYNSDLDIVVCYEKTEDDNPGDGGAEHFFHRLGRRFIHLLTTQTRAGGLYPLDMRLRPSGRSGTLVTSLSGFFDYQINSAWTWEHQALVRSRVVVGSSQFYENFEAAKKEILCRERDQAQLKKDVIDMRRKMIEANCRSTDRIYDLKLDEGGMVDIEFLVQYWILCHGHEHNKLVEPVTTSESISALVTHSVISPETGRELQACYKTYLRHSLDLKLMDRPVLAQQDELLAERNAVKEIWKETFG